MPSSVTLLIGIVAVTLALFVHGRLRVDLVGLLVLAALALTGLVTTQEALAGFASPAVVTIWAMFVLSTALTRTGLAHRIGRPLRRFAHGSEAVLIAALMIAAALLSALINTVTVAAVLLPVTMDLARRSGRPPSRLLLPLALGCLLGGPFTAISTSTNIIATDALRAAGQEAFGIFDFTPVTALVVVAGVVFMTVIGRHLLPKRPSEEAPGTVSELGRSYELEQHLLTARIPPGSPLTGMTLADSRLGSALFLTVVAIQRRGRLELGPRSDEVIRAGDFLILHGRPDHLTRFSGGEHLQVEDDSPSAAELNSRLRTARVTIGEESELVGMTLTDADLRSRHGVHVVSWEAGEEQEGLDLDRPIERGDVLVVRGEPESLARITSLGLVDELPPEGEQTDTEDGLRLLSLRVPEGSVLAGSTLKESRLGAGFGLSVMGIVRDGDLLVMPDAEEDIRADDTLLLEGSQEDLSVFEGLQGLEVEPHSAALLPGLESQQVGVTEVLLSPRATVAGRTLDELLFRDHYGVTVLAIWREGRAHRTAIQEMPLRFGDALLVYGNRRAIQGMARDPDFIVLDQTAAQTPRLEKAWIAGVVMTGVLAAAMTGLVPISIAALTGAALMVLTGCIDMEEAYRGIDWKVVFLVACMLPLGTAIDTTGAARMGADALLDLIGGLSPRWIVAALFLTTVIGTQVIPTAALVVMMAPVALSTSAAVGVSPQLLMMTVAIAGSSSFASPVSHPAHMLVMGPGGYRYTDYLRIGAPLTVVSLLVAVAILPIMFPP